MLELVGLRKQFPGVLALDDCTLRAPRGRVLGFLGRNGAGKTTAMRSIFGLVALDAGHALWDGAAITERQRVAFGYMPEERGLYPRMRTLDQVVYFARLRGLGAAVAGADARNWLRRLGLDDRAGDLVGSLSHGNQQRVQLAVSLVGQPPLLVLDEPFSGLDPVAAEMLSEVIRGEADRGAAVLFSSHQLDLVEDVCDDIAVIARGHVVLAGELSAIRSAGDVRYATFALDREVVPDELARLTVAIPGAEVVRAAPNGARVRLPAGTGPAAVMEAIGTDNAFEQFRFEPPSLADIFADVAGE